MYKNDNIMMNSKFGLKPSILFSLQTFSYFVTAIELIMSNYYFINKSEWFRESLGDYWPLCFELDLRTRTIGTIGFVCVCGGSITWPYIFVLGDLPGYCWYCLSLFLSFPLSPLITHFGVTQEAAFLWALILWPN